MISNADRATAQDLRDRISRIVPVLDFLVFGSCARGDATQESDLDVFVEAEHLSREIRRRISEIAWEVGFERDRVITTVVATSEQLNGMFGVSPLLKSIRRDGVRP